MLTVGLALLSALFYGVSDYAAGLAARAASVLRMSLVAQLACLATALMVVPWLSPLRLGSGSSGLGSSGLGSFGLGSFGMTGASVAWAAGAGAAGMCGGLLLYFGFRHSAFSVVSALSAVGAAALSVLAGLLLGERPGVLALTGIGLALPAVAAVSAGSSAPGHPPGTSAAGSPGTSVAGSPGTSAAGVPGRSAAGAPGRSAAGRLGRRLAGAGYGLASGACFAMYFTGLDRAGSGGGMWPAVTAAAATVPVVVVAAWAGGQLGWPDRRTCWLGVATGVTGEAGTLLYFAASQHGLLAVAAVITSLYPATTIGLARVLLGERLGLVRIAGLCLAGASVALIAASGAG